MNIWGDVMVVEFREVSACFLLLEDGILSDTNSARKEALLSGKAASFGLAN